MKKQFESYGSGIFQVNIVACVAGTYRCVCGFSCFPIWLVFLDGTELPMGSQKLGKYLPCVDHCLAVVRSLGMNL